MYGRRARRMIRRIDSWSVLKVSLVFYLCLAGVALVAGTVMYNLARIGGFMARIERAMQEVGFENFRFVGSRTLMAAFLILTAGAVFMTAATVLMSFIYNLISEVVGGIEVSTLDELVDLAQADTEEVPEKEEPKKSLWRRRGGKAAKRAEGVESAESAAGRAGVGDAAGTAGKAGAQVGAQAGAGATGAGGAAGIASEGRPAAMHGGEPAAAKK